MIPLTPDRSMLVHLSACGPGSLGAPPPPAVTRTGTSASPATLDDALAKIEHLQIALETNRDIGVAIGIVMATGHLTKDEALGALRTTSQHHNRKLRDVAEQVILTGTLPTNPSDWF